MDSAPVAPRTLQKLGTSREKAKEAVSPGDGTYLEKARMSERVYVYQKKCTNLGTRGGRKQISERLNVIYRPECYMCLKGWVATIISLKTNDLIASYDHSVLYSVILFF